MPPENKNQSEPQQPPIQPVAMSGLRQGGAQPFQPAAQFESPQPRNNQRIVLILLVCAVVIGVIIAGVLAFAAPTDDNAKQSDKSEASKATPKEQSMPLTLVAYDNVEAGFTMMIPKEAELEGEADEANYTVDGGSHSDVYGNRLIMVSKQVYDDSLQISYDEYLESTDEGMQGKIVAAQESEVFETNAAITYESNWSVGEYRAQRYTLEESTRNRKNPDSKASEYRTSYMYVYVNPTTVYELEIRGRKDDAAFQSVVSKMIESFLVK